MDRRFLDPLFFAFLFALDVVIWLITWMLSITPEIVVVLAPAFASMTVLALIRASFGMNPRVFWAQLSVVTAVFLVFVGLAEALTPNLQSFTVSFSSSVGFMSMALLSSLIALFLAAFGAIATPEKAEPKVREPAPPAAQEEPSPQPPADEAAPEAPVAAPLSQTPTDQ